MPAEGVKTKGKAFGVKRILPKLTKENAVIPEGKLSDYALNPDHADGKNKAIAFQKALGYNKSNAKQLEETILSGLAGADKNYKGSTEYGDKISALMDVTGPNGKTAQIQTGWILKFGEEKFSLTTVYVKKRKGK